MIPVAVERRKRQRGRKIEVDPRRRGPWDHHRLIYNARDNRIHDQNPAFRGIDGSLLPCAALRQRWYFQMNPPFFLVRSALTVLQLVRRFPSKLGIIEFSRQNRGTNTPDLLISICSCLSSIMEAPSTMRCWNMCYRCIDLFVSLFCSRHHTPFDSRHLQLYLVIT